MVSEREDKRDRTRSALPEAPRASDGGARDAAPRRRGRAAMWDARRSAAASRAADRRSFAASEDDEGARGKVRRTSVFSRSTGDARSSELTSAAGRTAKKGSGRTAAENGDPHAPPSPSRPLVPRSENTHSRARTMSSRGGGPRSVGTDGSDHAYRQTVDNKYVKAAACASATQAPRMLFVYYPCGGVRDRPDARGGSMPDVHSAFAAGAVSAFCSPSSRTRR